MTVTIDIMWSATTPTTEKLQIWADASCPDGGCFWIEQGQTPLRLTFSAPDGVTEFRMVVGAADPCTGPLLAGDLAGVADRAIAFAQSCNPPPARIAYQQPFHYIVTET